ncbi:MAG: 7-cyano-7-deazaguanine synthase QueC [Armatimonadota bacterium]
MSSVVLLSGGLDSVVAAYASRRRHPPRLTITFDYGQRAARRELEAALRITADLGADHRLIKLPWLGKLAPASLCDQEADLSEATDESVWVPARNAIFISIAASFAEALECEAIVVGFNAEEGATFPDNTLCFMRRCEAMLELATRSAPMLVSPTVELTKREIVALGLEVGAPLHLVWSCYGAGPEHCFECPSCRRLRKALQEAGYWQRWRELRSEAGVQQ